MIDATFKQRAKTKDNSDTFNTIIQAKTAELHFDLERGWSASTSTRPRCRTTARTTTSC